MSTPPPKKPKFAEAMTQVRASTMIRRLKDLPSQPGSTSAESDAAERTFVAGAHGFDFGGGEDSTGSHTDPNQLPVARPIDRSGRPLPAQPSALAPQPTVVRPLDAPREATRSVELPLDQAVTGEQPGEVIVLFGCRGGAGSTTIAVNLGVQLAKQARGCVVVDLDLQMGDVLCALQLDPVETIAEVLQDIDALDEASLRRRLTFHPSGLFALSQGDRFDQLESLLPERIPALIAGLSRQFGTVLIDGLRDFSDLSISALDMADKIVMIVPEDVVAVKNASRCLEVFRRLGYPSSKLSIVVNRHDGKAKVTPAAIAATLKLEPIGLLAHDPRAAQEALDEGKPLSEIAPRSPLTETLGHLAERVGKGKPLDTASAARKGGLLASLRALFGGGK